MLWWTSVLLYSHTIQSDTKNLFIVENKIFLQPTIQMIKACKHAYLDEIIITSTSRLALQSAPKS